MHTKNWQAHTIATVALMSLMAGTRFHHFGSAFSLPDASLAVFFLAGLGVGHTTLFVLLLAEAGLIDFIAISHMGVSDYCISPAYLGLLPTYAVMWFAGVYSKTFNLRQVISSLKLFVCAFAATSVAFFISNGSFYVFSGKFATLSYAQYFSRTATYYPPYLSAVLIYVVAGLGVKTAVKALAEQYESRNAAL